jgi:hypothetical protein
VTDRAAFRAAATSCVLLCLIWDLTTVVLLILLPLQLAAIGLLYWGADGLIRMGTARSVQRPGRGGSCRPDAGDGGPQPVRHWPGGGPEDYGPLAAPDNSA